MQVFSSTACFVLEMENSTVYISYFFSEHNIEMAAETQAQTIMTTPIQSRDHAPHFCAKKEMKENEMKYTLFQNGDHFIIFFIFMLISPLGLNCICRIQKNF